jgi:hypothetical protein
MFIEKTTGWMVLPPFHRSGKSRRGEESDERFTTGFPNSPEVAIKEPSAMRTTTLTFPELILIAATRGLLGAGIALLIAKRLTEEQRETAGTILTAIGLLTTVPLALEAFGKSERL